MLAALRCASCAPRSYTKPENQITQAAPFHSLTSGCAGTLERLDIACVKFLPWMKTKHCMLVFEVKLPKQGTAE